MTLVRFMHFLGFSMWLGGGLAAMVLALSARRESATVRATVHALLTSVHTMIIGLGALLTVASGILLTMELANEASSAVLSQPRIWVMQGAGLIGGLLVLLVGLPAAIKLGGLSAASDDGRLPDQFDKYRKRNALANAVGGTLALVALFAAVVLR